jgi:hypothetical protein
MGCCVAEVVVRGKDQPRRLGRRDHPARLGYGHGEGLFAEDVLARRNGGHRLGVVLLVGGRDVDGIHGSVGEHLVEGGRGRGDAVAGRVVRRVPGLPAHHPGDVRARLRPEGTNHVLGRDRAGPDKSPLHLQASMERSKRLLERSIRVKDGSRVLLHNSG